MPHLLALGYFPRAAGTPSRVIFDEHHPQRLFTTTLITTRYPRWRPGVAQTTRSPAARNKRTSRRAKNRRSTNPLNGDDAISGGSEARSTTSRSATSRRQQVALWIRRQGFWAASPAMLFNRISAAAKVIPSDSDSISTSTLRSPSKPKFMGILSLPCCKSTFMTPYPYGSWSLDIPCTILLPAQPTSNPADLGLGGQLVPCSACTQYPIMCLPETKGRCRET